MRTLASLVMVAWTAFGASGAAASAASPSEAFAAATAAFADADYERALARFLEAREQGLDGPAIHYNIGVCQYKVGDFERAAATFALIAERYPAMSGLARYNLGLVARKQGDELGAETHFRAAFAASEDEKIRRLAQRQLELEPSAAPREWLTFIDARLGYDDNVLLLAEDVLLPDGQSAESRFTEFWALVSGPSSPGQGFRFDGSLYTVHYPDASVFDQTMLRAGAAYEWRFGDWRAEAGPHLTHATLDGSAFERRLGAGIRVRRDIAANAELAVRYVHDEVAEGEARFASFAGSREWLELRLDRFGAQTRLTLAYALEANERAGANVSPARNKLSLRYRYFLGPQWLADVHASLRESRYDGSADAREEDLAELSVSLTRSFSDGWEAGGALALADNDSDLEFLAYERNRVSVGFAKQF